MEMTGVLLSGMWILYPLVAVCVLYAIVRFAIVHAFRQARHEARLEQHVPNAATWLKGEERSLLEMSNSAHERRG